MSFVYLIGAKRDLNIIVPFKVGISSNPKRRLVEMRSHSPHELELYVIWKYLTMFAAQKAEWEFQKKHKDARDHGEWFRMTREEITLSLDEIYDHYMKTDVLINGECTLSFMGALGFQNLNEKMRISNKLTKEQLATRKQFALKLLRLKRDDLTSAPSKR